MADQHEAEDRFRGSVKKLYDVTGTRDRAQAKIAMSEVVALWSAAWASLATERDVVEQPKRQMFSAPIKATASSSGPAKDDRR